jgi:uncharacterized OsmC-like protein
VRAEHDREVPASVLRARVRERFELGPHASAPFAFDQIEARTVDLAQAAAGAARLWSSHVQYPESSMSDAFNVELTQQADYRFVARFDNPAIPALLTDEPAPLGHDAGPNPARLLAVAIANCLAASLLFALRKFRNEPAPLRAEARMRLVRNAQNRWRVGVVQVDLHLGVPAAGLKQLERALAQFEDFCIVTQSLRASFPVDVRVFDSLGAELHTSTEPDAARDGAALGAA